MFILDLLRPYSNVQMIRNAGYRLRSSTKAWQRNQPSPDLFLAINGLGFFLLICLFVLSHYCKKEVEIDYKKRRAIKSRCKFDSIFAI